MDALIIGVLIINLFFSIIYFIYAVVKGKNKWVFFLFATLPVLGFCFCFFSKAVLYYSNKFNYDRESLVRRFEFAKSENIPNLKKELDVAPIEDTMAISSDKEKRALLLDQLKKNIDENYKIVLPASKDKDSESAHYVATAKMEVYRKKYKELKEFQEELYNNPNDVQFMNKYLDILYNYINSELLTSKEQALYEMEYCKYFESLIIINPAMTTAIKNTAYIKYLIDLGEKKSAEEYWHNCIEALKNEDGYMEMLAMYYDVRDKENFYKCLEDLKNSSVKLSSKGLKVIRYWIVKEY